MDHGETPKDLFSECLQGSQSMKPVLSSFPKILDFPSCPLSPATPPSVLLRELESPLPKSKEIEKERIKLKTSAPCLVN